MQRGPRWAGDQVAVDEGVVHGDTDVRATTESYVRASGRIGAALLPVENSRNGQNLWGMADSGQWLIGF